MEQMKAAASGIDQQTSGDFRTVAGRLGLIGWVWVVHH